MVGTKLGSVSRSLRAPSIDRERQLHASMLANPPGLAIRFRGPFPEPPPEPLREGALVFAPIDVQTTRRTLYKRLDEQLWPNRFACDELNQVPAMGPSLRSDVKHSRSAKGAGHEWKFPSAE